MELSELIGIVDLIVTITVGFWLTRYLSNRDTSSRVLKDYYIEEAKALQNDVRIFFARLLSNHVAGAELARWHKSHKNKFKAFDKNLRESFPVECPSVNTELFNIHREITNFEEFNNGFSTGAFNFSPNTRARIDELEGSALTLLNDYVVQVNNSTGLSPMERIVHDLKHEYVYYIKKMHFYFRYLLLQLWRFIEYTFVFLIFYWGFCFLRDLYLNQAQEKLIEKELMQRNIDKALNSIEDQNAKLDSIDLDLRMIKENMRIRKGVNNYWIHTNCSKE